MHEGFQGMPKWTLGWKHYVRRGMIKAVPDVVTYIIGWDPYDKLDAARAGLFKEALQKEGLRQQPHPGAWNEKGRVMDVLQGTRTVALYEIDTTFGDIVVRCISGKLQGVFDRLVEGDLTEDAMFAGKVVHGERCFRLRSVPAAGTVVTGVVDQNEIYLYPYKFYELRTEEELIAKALVSHFNHEMAESAPTIELIEVVNGLRGYGIGKKLVSLIERHSLNEGFDRIWATDAGTSVSFWEHMGYDFDLDEGMKYLE